AITKASAVVDNQLTQLAVSDYYKVWKLNVVEEAVVEQSYPFLIVSVLEGYGIIDGHSVKKGDHMLIPSGYGKISMLGNMELIVSTAVEK
ncbi:MAG: beta-glucosidase, partial [Lachnospiraceae bacterium]|nr:beta-glucosidase [Lachnospiraceae bacterium]